MKQKEIRLTYYKYAFFCHVFSSIVIIVLGLTQFSRTILKQFPKIHRLNGKGYILLILLISSPSGLILAYHANGGLISKISFSFLSILWFVFTLKAYTFIKKKDFAKHRDFMIRSYALTLSAISLRLFKYGIVFFFALPPMDTYKIVSVLGWTINLGIAEILIMKISMSTLKTVKDLNI
ncbi:MAG: DUF2306 domain-containing protein [Leadbetterella sp.]